MRMQELFETAQAQFDFRYQKVAKYVTWLVQQLENGNIADEDVINELVNLLSNLENRQQEGASLEELEPMLKYLEEYIKGTKGLNIGAGY